MGASGIGALARSMADSIDYDHNQVQPHAASAK
jgi:hypothetical protein